jgi:protein-disulfide isomerase
MSLESSNQTRILIWTVVALTFGILGFAIFRFGGTGSGSLPPITAEDHSVGKEDAPVTLVEYSDFQCPACASYHPLVKQLIKELSTSTLRFVARHFPLPMHENAEEAARAAEAAGKQNKYWEMHDLLFERQNFWEQETNPDQKFLSYAELLGLNTTTFVADYNSSDVKSRIQRVVIGGEAAGVDRTPLFFLNGQRVTDLPTNYEALKKLVTDAAK